MQWKKQFNLNNIGIKVIEIPDDIPESMIMDDDNILNNANYLLKNI